MFGIGLSELLIILFIVLIIFGASRLPEIGAGLGQGIKNFKKAFKEDKAIDVTPQQELKEKAKLEEKGKVEVEVEEKSEEKVKKET